MSNLKKCLLVAIVAATTGFAYFTTTHNNMPSDLRDAVGEPEFNTDIPVVKTDANQNIPIPDVPKAEEPAKSGVEHYYFAVQVLINLDEPHMKPGQRKMKREIFKIFKESGLDYSYTVERAKLGVLNNYYDIAYRPKGELRVRKLPDTSVYMDLEGIRKALKKFVTVMPYPDGEGQAYLINYLSAKEIKLMEGVFTDAQLEQKLKELNAELVYLVKNEKGQSAVFYITK